MNQYQSNYHRGANKRQSEILTTTIMITIKIIITSMIIIIIIIIIIAIIIVSLLLYDSALPFSQNAQIIFNYSLCLVWFCWVRSTIHCFWEQNLGE